MILTFSVAGFRCFADQVTLDLREKKFKTMRPPAGKTWSQCVIPTAGVYGANASGKTTLISSFAILTAAIRSPLQFSRSLFQPSGMISFEKQQTRYEVEFVVDGTRYQYILVVQRWGVSFEGLYSYPKTSKRVLFERRQTTGDADAKFYKGPNLTGPTAEVLKLMSVHTPFLAISLLYEHPILAPIAKGIALGDGVRAHTFQQATEEKAIQRIILEMLAAPTKQAKVVSALLEIADLGIEGIDIRYDEIPDQVRAKAQTMLESVRDAIESEWEVEFPRIIERVVFIHKGDDGKTFEVPLKWQSTGTLAWLGLAWNAVSVLNEGGTLLVDELDASLHPMLVRYLVKLFQDQQLNSAGAQLIFTTHDVSLLGNTPTQTLQPEHVWFTEKDEHGKSELFSLDEFENRSGNNSEKRYMAGQFGAVPYIDDFQLYELLLQQD